jgi:hypothetical protein
LYKFIIICYCLHFPFNTVFINSDSFYSKKICKFAFLFFIHDDKCNWLKCTWENALTFFAARETLARWRMGIELWRNTTSFPPGIEPISKGIDKQWRKNPGTKWKKPCLKTTNRQSATIINCTNVEGHLVVFSANCRWQKFTAMYLSVMVPFYIHLPKVKKLKISSFPKKSLQVWDYIFTTLLHVSDRNGSSNKAKLQ